MGNPSTKAAMEGKGKQPAYKTTPCSTKSSQESLTMQVAYKRKGAKWKELTELVTYFIAEDSLLSFIRLRKVASRGWLEHLSPDTNCIPVKQDLADVLLFSYIQLTFSQALRCAHT